MSNPTLSFLYAQSPLSTMGFSGATGTSTVALNGPGGQSGAGHPLPRRGYVTALYLWDGSTLRANTDEIAFSAGDRLGVYCQNTGSDFTVKVRLNGSTTALQVTGVPFNTTLLATVEFVLVRES